MTQDVRQWLAEIKLLQQQVSDAHKERDQAYASAANWRSLYETEAKQRRTEAMLAKQQIEALQGELQQLRIGRSRTPTPENVTTQKQTVEQDVAQLSISELRERLVDALLECDRLTQALQAEQSHHAQTRNNLTTALGDTVDLLTKGRSVSES